MRHPPVGFKPLQAASCITKIEKINLSSIFVACQWLVTMLVFLVIVTYWPGLSLWLPRTLGMMH